MTKKMFVVMFCLLAVFLLAVAVLGAASYYKPSKYKGLALGVAKKELFKPRENPCAKFGCTPWDTFVGDKTTKKAYNCRCKLPSDLTKDKALCFRSAANAKKAKPGYRVENCKV